MKLARLAFDYSGDTPLLRDRKNIVHQPVKHESGGEEREESSENEGQYLHDLGLRRIQRCWIEFLLHPHADPHQQGKDKKRILLGQILDPEHERSLANLNTFEQHPVQGNENGYLDEDGKTSSQRIDFFFLVQLHHRLVQLCFVVRKAVA